MEVRYLNDGTPVGELSVAWNFGRKDAEGRRPTQWAKLSLFGDRAEKLAPFLLKGQQIFAVVGEVNIETFAKRDGGQGFNLVGRIESIEFAGSQQHAAEPAAAPAPQRAPAQQQGGYRTSGPRTPPAPAPRPAPAPAPKGASGFDDLDDDVPF